MCDGSASDFSMASAAAAARDCARVSTPAFGSSGGAITSQSRAFTRICHCPASAGSGSTMAGCLAGAGWAIAGVITSRLIMAQAAADFLGEFLNVFGLLDGRQGDYETVVLLQFLLHLLRQLGKLGRILEILLVLRLENLVLLQLAVRQA